MFGSLLVTLLCGYAVAILSPDLDKYWGLWKKMHNKVYSDQVDWIVICQHFPTEHAEPRRVVGF